MLVLKADQRRITHVAACKQEPSGVHNHLVHKYSGGAQTAQTAK